MRGFPVANADWGIARRRLAAGTARIAENAYRDIIESGKYTYRVFANQVVEQIAKNAAPKAGETLKEKLFSLFVRKYLMLREWIEPILVKWFYVWLGLKIYRTGIVKRLWQRIKAGRI